MADPVTLSGALFSVSSLAGIIGNLVASALWDGGKWVGQLDAIAKLFADDNRNNHDLLRALRRAERQTAALGHALRASPVAMALFGGLQPIAPAGLPEKHKQRMAQPARLVGPAAHRVPRGTKRPRQPARADRLADGCAQHVAPAARHDLSGVRKKFDAIDAKLAGIREDTQAIRAGPPDSWPNTAFP